MSSFSRCITGLAPISFFMIWPPSDSSRRSARLSNTSRRAPVARLASRDMWSGLNGFSRKSNAPTRIASTAIGTSPWPVIMMTGSALSCPISFFRNCIPSMPGIRMSEITMPGYSGPSTRSASSALAKVSVSYPDRASHWLIDWRMSCSSSTIAIFIAWAIGRIPSFLFGGFYAVFLHDRQLHFENGSTPLSVPCRQPSAVIRDNSG